MDACAIHSRRFSELWICQKDPRSSDCLYLMFSLPDQKTQLKCFDQNMTSVCSRHIRTCLLC